MDVAGTAGRMVVGMVVAGTAVAGTVAEGSAAVPDVEADTADFAVAQSYRFRPNRSTPSLQGEARRIDAFHPAFVQLLYYCYPTDHR